MSPSIALLGCYFFVAFVYVRDRRTNPYPSVAIWLPVLWMMRCASRTFDAWFTSNEGRLDPVVIALMILGAAVILVRRRCDWGQVMARNSALFFFYAYLCASVLWTEGLENPVIKVMRPLGDLLMALVVVTELKPSAAIMTVFRRTAIFLIPMSIVLIRYFPYLGKIEDKHWGLIYGSGSPRIKIRWDNSVWFRPSLLSGVWSKPGETESR